MSKHCFLCLSPYRSEVVQLWKDGVSPAEIYRRFKTLMKYKASSKAFYNVVYHHINKNHNTEAIMVPSPSGFSKVASIESFGQRMLELGTLKIESMTPGEVQLKDVISAQKLVIDSKKLKITEDAMMIALGKLFGPTLNTEIIEGEESV